MNKKNKHKYTLWETMWDAICNMFYFKAKWKDITYLNEVSKLLK